MKRLRHIPTILLASLTIILAGCEKPVINGGEDDIETPNGKKHRISFVVAPDIQVAFRGDTNNDSESENGTPAEKAVGDVCSRLSLAVFKEDGEKLFKNINSTSSDDNFGTFGVDIPNGTYQVVLFAHSGEKNVTISSPTELNADYKVTDSFYTYETINVNDETKDFSFSLKRCVAKIHLTFTVPLDSNIKQMRFSYTGGSSTLDATTGFGKVNSRQSEKQAIDNYDKPEFDIYTYPHEESDELKITVEALDAQGNIVQQKELNGIPVKLNYTTEVKGDFFGENPDDGRGKITVTLNDEWAGTIPYYF